MTCQADHLVTDILDEMKMEEHMQSVIQTPQLYVSVAPWVIWVLFIHAVIQKIEGPRLL